jgi:hypothetical protein
MVTKKNLSPSLQQPKNSHCQTYGDRIFFVHTGFTTTEMNPILIPHKLAQGSSKVPLT